MRLTPAEGVKIDGELSRNALYANAGDEVIS